MKLIEVYHTQEKREELLRFPILAEGNKQWLGDGFYFWQDYEFAHWWGDLKKPSKSKAQFSIYKANLKFNENDFIDTVFNEHDYYNFVNVIERFAKKYESELGRKASLEDFNDFIDDHAIWQNIKIIRFQDLPKNSNLVQVKGFYYKKRIQIRVNDPEIIVSFVHFKNFLCEKHIK